MVSFVTEFQAFQQLVSSDDDAQVIVQLFGLFLAERARWVHAHAPVAQQVSQASPGVPSVAAAPVSDEHERRVLVCGKESYTVLVHREWPPSEKQWGALRGYVANKYLSIDEVRACEPLSRKSVSPLMASGSARRSAHITNGFNQPQV